MNHITDIIHLTFVPTIIALADGWQAIGEAGGWRGVHPDGRRTHLHLNPIVVREVIAQGWLEGRESPITPRAYTGMRIARGAKAGKR